MPALLELAAEEALEEMRRRAREGMNPCGRIVRSVVDERRCRPIPAITVPMTGTAWKTLPVWRTFDDVQALNESLDDPAFGPAWQTVRAGGQHIVRVKGTLYPYEPICAGSSAMWRDYWSGMQQALTERLARPGAAPIGRRDKLRDWFTYSLFLWGFSLSHEPAPNEPRWLGIGSMDEINGLPVLLAPGLWETVGASLFTGPGRAWDVEITGYLERRPLTTDAPGKLRQVLKLLEREFYLLVTAPEQLKIVARSVYYSAYVWALFETPAGDAYGLWEHANIADADLFDEGVARLGRKAAELCARDDQLAAALTPEVDAALGKRGP